MTASNDEGLWTKYERVGVIEARPWTDEDARRFAAEAVPISVSQADHSIAYVRPAQGFVARNPSNHLDQWYIAPDYFAKHYRATPKPADSELRRALLESADEIEFHGTPGSARGNAALLRQAADKS